MGPNQNLEIEAPPDSIVSDPLEVSSQVVNINTQENLDSTQPLNYVLNRKKPNFFQRFLSRFNKREAVAAGATIGTVGVLAIGGVALANRGQDIQNEAQLNDPTRQQILNRGQLDALRTTPMQNAGIETIPAGTPKESDQTPVDPAPQK